MAKVQVLGQFDDGANYATDGNEIFQLVENNGQYKATRIDPAKQQRIRSVLQSQQQARGLPAQDQKEQQIQTLAREENRPVGSPGFVGGAVDLARGVGRGVVSTLPQMTGQTLQFFDQPGGSDTARDFGKKLETFSHDVLEKLPWLKASARELVEAETNPLGVRGAAGMGGEMLAPSMGPALTGAAIGTAIMPGPGTAVGGAVGFLASLPLFFGAEAEETYRAGLEKGINPEVAYNAALTNGSVEAGGELLADLVTWRLFRFMPKPVRDNLIQSMMKGLRPAGEMVKDFGIITAAQVGTELGQGYIQQKVRADVGIDEEQPDWDSVKPIIMPTIILSVLTFGTGETVGGFNRRILAKTLADPETSPESRANAVETVYNEAAKVDPELAQQWLLYTEPLLRANQPIVADTIEDKDLRDLPPRTDQTEGQPQHVEIKQETLQTAAPESELPPVPTQTEEEAPLKSHVEQKIKAIQERVDRGEAYTGKVKAELGGLGFEAVTTDDGLKFAVTLGEGATPQAIRAARRVAGFQNDTENDRILYPPEKAERVIKAIRKHLPKQKTETQAGAAVDKQGPVLYQDVQKAREAFEKSGLAADEKTLIEKQIAFTGFRRTARAAKGQDTANLDQYLEERRAKLASIGQVKHPQATKKARFGTQPSPVKRRGKANAKTVRGDTGQVPGVGVAAPEGQGEGGEDLQLDKAGETGTAAADTSQEKITLPGGWEEGSPGGIATNKDEKTGGIVDSEIKSGKWFVVANDERIGTLEGFNSRAEALAALQDKIQSVTPVDVTAGKGIDDKKKKKKGKAVTPPEPPAEELVEGKKPAPETPTLTQLVEQERIKESALRAIKKLDATEDPGLYAKLSAIFDHYEKQVTEQEAVPAQDIGEAFLADERYLSLDDLLAIYATLPESILAGADEDFKFTTEQNQVQAIFTHPDLGDINVNVMATVQETGETVQYQEQADVALRENEDQLTLARQLLACLRS